MRASLALPQLGEMGWKYTALRGHYSLAANVQQADLEWEPPMERGKSPVGNTHSLPAISYLSCFSSFAVTGQEGALACPLPLLRFQAHSSALCFPLISLLYAQGDLEAKNLGVI